MRGAECRSVSAQLGIAGQWATVAQVHGASLCVVESYGNAGEADALATMLSGLPLAVFTADCGGVVLESLHSVAVIHAGWRGAAAGVVGTAASWMAHDGGVQRAALGPTIGPCCFEVGEEVAAQFPEHQTTTTWGSVSVDLPAAITAQLPDVQWWSADACTRCGKGWFSHRRDATPSRLATLGWMP